jgi:signal transduction histidine kinase
LLATNVLNLSKVENQTILSEKHSFGLGEQVRRCIIMLESKWEQKKITLNVDIQDIFYVGNEELLNQVWLNLLDNSIKFTPENGTISIVLKQTGNKAEFFLRDSGCGISSDNVRHIFDKFYQADTSHATAGNGLGLTLAQKIIKLHGGSITCKSELGAGTEFTVQLPLK